MSKSLVVRGARTHNLKDITVKIPRDKLVVITGVSGSGKSSLAFDTIYAEGQRRYVESLSTYARQFLQLQEKPEVESIEGLSPAISIDQKTASRNPRSTVGTVTEIYDYLRLLFAKLGTPVHPETKKPLMAQSPSQMVDTINQWPEGVKFLVMAPMIADQKGAHRDVLEAIQRAGFIRLRVDGEVRTINEKIVLDPKQKHTIEVVVDRLTKTDYALPQDTLSDGRVVTGKNENRLRLVDSIETALRYGQQRLIVHRLDEEQDHLFSETLSDPETGLSFPPVEPRLFSFNSPHGACEACHGLGYRLRLNKAAAVNPNLSIREGGLMPWKMVGSNVFAWYLSVLRSVGERYGFTIDEPLSEFSAENLERILDGTGQEVFAVALSGANRGKTTEATWEGLSQQTEKRYNETDSDFLHRRLREFLLENPCPDCEGSRLNVFARHVLIDGTSLDMVGRWSIPQVRDWLAGLDFSAENLPIVEPIRKELLNRLSFLENVGLEYLNLMRSANTLSGGEAQRIRLATQIGSQLEGVLYVLDEPSIGLHQRDNEKLINTMKQLRDLGNTVLVVEHDEDTMKEADFLVEIGPQAGAHGGELVFSGSLKELLSKAKTETADFLTGRQHITIPKRRRRPTSQLKIIGAQENNLQDVTVEVPLGVLTGITGVSGSGKSSLINRILAPVLARDLNRAKRPAGAHKAIEGVDALDKLILIDQSPIGRNPRSNPATYTMVFNDIRELFAATPEARSRGYNSGRFSFNIKGGRCEDCNGDGVKKIEMHFLPDVYVTCESCQGQRYNPETLEITYRGKNINEVLNLTVEEAHHFFAAIPAVVEKTAAMLAVGLGYVQLGQSSTTLSGGEAQRVKLATELMRRSTGKTAYILDEPTTGLHFSDVKKLLEVLNRLVDKGNSVLVIEHNLDVIKTCDWLIDMGPDGGTGGGRVVATGTPEKVAECPESYTGIFLKRWLQPDFAPCKE